MESNDDPAEVLCLRRRHSDSTILVPLLKGHEVTIGRGYDVTVQLLSEKNPLMLSRKHVIFKQNEEEKWTATDNKSLNGVYVNGDRIIAALPWIINIGDTLQLDIPTTDTDPEYLFDVVQEGITLVEAQRILDEHREDIAQRKRNKGKGVAVIAKRQCIACVTRTSTYPHCPVHCAKARISKDGAPSCSRPNDNACLCRGNTGLRTRDENTQGPAGPPHKRFRAAGGGSVVSREQMELQKRLEEEARERQEEKERLQKQLEEESRKAEERAAEAQSQLVALQRQLQEQEAAKEKLQEEMKVKENEAKSEVEKSHRELLAEREKAEVKLKEALEAEIKAREVEQEKKMRLQMEGWVAEKEGMEMELKEQWEQKLKEKEETLEAAKLEKEKQLESEFKEKEAAFLEKMEADKALLSEEKSKVEKDLQDEFSKKLSEKEDNLKKMQEDNTKMLDNWMKERENIIQRQLEEERKMLLAKKEEAEKVFKEEMEQKSKEFSTKMTAEKRELEEVVARKERELADRMNELSARQLEQETKEAEINQAKEAALKHVEEVMESELQCMICTELLIEATTINCTHTFCKHCINRWRQCKNECPSCRAKITTQTRSLALDNYIQEALKTIGEETRLKREQMVKERKDEVQATAADSAPVPVPRPSHATAQAAAPRPAHTTAQGAAPRPAHTIARPAVADAGAVARPGDAGAGTADRPRQAGAGAASGPRDAAVGMAARPRFAGAGATARPPHFVARPGPVHHGFQQFVPAPQHMYGPGYVENYHYWQQQRNARGHARRQDERAVRSWRY